LPSAGVSAGPNGAAVGGGVSIFWGDLLARRRLGLALQAQGRVQDVGGQVFYLNSVSRWNVFASVGRTPVPSVSNATGRVRVRDGTGRVFDATVVESGVARTVLNQATVGAQYPFSRTRRLELATTGNHITRDFDLTRQVINPVTGQLLDRQRVRGSFGDPLQYLQWSVALVGDDAVFGATSPQDGWRYRVELAHTSGSTRLNEVTVDGRWYQPLWRGTLAVRGMHVGRYGRDAELGLLAPLFVGANTLVRGYDAASLADRECVRPDANGACPAFDRLLGSRIAVAGVEYRLSAERLGVRGLGVELAPFLDAGLAWTAGRTPTLRPTALSRAVDTSRPVLSHGVALRLNAGALILELFHARPLQRGGGVFGLNVAPGW
jgi:hypothetical protein